MLPKHISVLILVSIWGSLIPSSFAIYWLNDEEMSAETGADEMGMEGRRFISKLQSHACENQYGVRNFCIVSDPPPPQPPTLMYKGCCDDQSLDEWRKNDASK